MAIWNSNLYVQKFVMEHFRLALHRIHFWYALYKQNFLKLAVCSERSFSSFNMN